MAGTGTYPEGFWVGKMMMFLFQLRWVIFRGLFIANKFARDGLKKQRMTQLVKLRVFSFVIKIIHTKL